MSIATVRPTVAIVGGGLAGLAAAVALCEQGLQVQLYESRRRLGGRATSFRDPSSGELVDHCQHVSMGCCTNFADFCRRTGIAEAFQSDSRLHFFGRDGRACTLEASRWLPAPLHLAPSLWRQKYLSPGQRLSIARTLWRLIRLRVDDDESQPAIGRWLESQGQSPAAIKRFWSVVLVSALGETLDRASLVQARKVFVDGFLAARQACRIDVPRIPLGDLYARLQDWLARRQVAIHLGTAVKRIDGDASAVTAVDLADGDRRPCDAAIVAVPWGWAPLMFSAGVLSMLPNLEAASQIECAPISGIHLWFDRQITPLPHAVLVGRLSQWIFSRVGNWEDAPRAGVPLDARGETNEADSTPSTRHPPAATHYYQVVVSASRSIEGRPRQEILRQVVAELAEVWPAAQEARLVRWRIVTEHTAVFSVRPGLDRLRPPQRTPIANLALAGDWTRTGWPSTMEGAVRSGYLAAEVILEHFGMPRPQLVPDLPRNLLTRLLIKA